MNLTSEVTLHKIVSNNENSSPNKTDILPIIISGSSRTITLADFQNDLKPEQPELSTADEEKKDEVKSKKDMLKAKREADKLSEEQYKSEQREQAYKRLMHLLTKSKFYSSFLCDKINGNDTSKPSEKRKTKDSLKKQQPALKKQAKNNKFDDILSPQARERLKNKINLNEKQIEAELIILSSDDSDDDDEKVSTNYKKPKYLEAELRDYQVIGLKWLTALHENGMSGILADEMGLGKTIQTISLICYLTEKHIPGPYLIICPLSTLPNWQNEFKKFAPKIPVVTLHGNHMNREQQKRQINKQYIIDNYFKTYPVVLTTYETSFFEKSHIIKNKWRYIIIDEGQRLKNKNSSLFKMLRQCKSIHRLLLTGTPLQNDLSELWSLLNFLMPDVFNDLDIFESWFDIKDLLHDKGKEKFLKQEKDKNIITHLREILKPFMLRRLKSDVCPDIPLKKEVVIYAPMTDIQRELYTAMLNRDIHSASKFNKPAVNDGLMENNQTSTRTSVMNKYCLNYNDVCDGLNKKSAVNLSSTSHGKLGVNKNSNRRSTRSSPALVDEDTRSELEKIWGEHVKITNKNRDYLLNINSHRAVMYKMIVNHPYIINHPKNNAGEPLIDENLIKSSGKFLVLDAMLKKLYEQGHKVLIFSTWIQILDYIEDYLEMRPWKWTRLDGKFKTEDRQHNIDLFNNDPSVFLFLITTRAGGVGLNLMGADTVIIFDSDWNPQADIQAMARCHRIGQKNPVMIYKLCTKGSYDELIVNRGVAKRKLEKLVISKELNLAGSTDNDSLMVMKELLKETEHEIFNSKKGIFNNEELEKLLDRSDLINQIKKNSEKLNE
ncbi:hypothetical protein HCN44_006923 [Aphidius gifuensis]|uniref:Uncharacterized protein n=1 Tax=Aphidius gifuensis TaxID=684658 RepID=A0A834XZN3_APHGI|nr:lymphocyte-specific helicase-like [Aphidius gifuensis]KAF7995816.1 hypothetical protein HCN44_006923 [Aphidius gifuensis]